ncbi:MAG: YihY/virulence factor BrkB family protein, partial [Phycisphaeraceae bacterium]
EIPAKAGAMWGTGCAYTLGSGERGKQMQIKRWWGVAKEAGSDWLAHGAMMHAAALAFYAMLSLAPLVVLLLAVVGMVWGQQAAEGELLNQTREMVGEDGAQMIQTVVKESDNPSARNLSAILGLVMIIVAATGVFTQLQTSLNTVWSVQRKSGTVTGVITTRLIAFGLVLLIGFLLLISMMLSAVVTTMAQYAQDWMPAGMPTFVPYLAELSVSLVVITVLLGMIFKYLPDVEVAWKDVLAGAFAAAVLFVIGKFLIGLYLGMAGVGSAYGAAGSLVVLLVWVYYSALILLLGAELTQVYVRRMGDGVKPAAHAERVRMVSGPEAQRIDREHGQGTTKEG